MTRIIAVSAGAGSPSSTRKLADRMLRAVVQQLPGVETSVIDVRELAGDLLTATTSGLRSDRLAAAMEQVAATDALIAVTPVFNGSYSGLFKLFFDALDDGTLSEVPVLLGATGGTIRHSLAIDQAMVPLFFFLRARPLPWPVYAATEDWADPRGLDARVRAAADALVLELAGGQASDGAADGRADGGQDSRRARVQPSDDFELAMDFEQMLADLGRPES